VEATAALNPVEVAAESLRRAAKANRVVAEANREVAARNEFLKLHFRISHYREVFML